MDANVPRPISPFVHFKLATHLWNVHRVDCYEMTFDGLRQMHRYFNCPIGPVARNFTCRFRFVPRRTPKRRPPAH